MRGRRVGRRIVRTAATTAVVVGTAHAVSGAMAPNQQAEEQVVYEAPAPVAGPDLTVQLQQLTQMHAAGGLTDEEFAAAKQKLLAG